MQTSRQGHFCFVLSLSPRLYAFLNKRILDRRLTYNNSYLCARSCISCQQGSHLKNSWRICDLICVALYLQSSYFALGYSASCLSHDFYTIPGLSHLLTDNVVKSLQYVPNYRLRFVVRILWTLSLIHQLIRFETTTWRPVQFGRSEKTVLRPYTINKLYLMRGTWIVNQALVERRGETVCRSVRFVQIPLSDHTAISSTLLLKEFL